MEKCNKCHINLRYKKEQYTCGLCEKIFCGSHIYSYVDGNNKAITKNSLYRCAICWGSK